MELKVRSSAESLTLNEKLNKKNKSPEYSSIKERLEGANVMIEECQDKICYLTQERDYARTHQKIVEIPVEKPVLYEKM